MFAKRKNDEVSRWAAFWSWIGNHLGELLFLTIVLIVGAVIVWEIWDSNRIAAEEPQYSANANLAVTECDNKNGRAGYFIACLEQHGFTLYYEEHPVRRAN